MKLFAAIAIVLSVTTLSIAEDGEVATFEQPQYYFVTYIESLCPYSAKFITQQLYPNYELIKDFVTVLVFSCGKVKVTQMRDGTVEQACQHGDEECAKNKQQCCAMRIIPNEADRVKFIYCTMSDITEANDYSECAKQVGADFDAITACANSPLGDALHQKCLDESADYMEQTHKVPICVWGNSSHPEYDSQIEAFIHNDFNGFIDYMHRVENSTAAAVIEAANAEDDAEEDTE